MNKEEKRKHMLEYYEEWREDIEKHGGSLKDKLLKNLEKPRLENFCDSCKHLVEHYDVVEKEQHYCRFLPEARLIRDPEFWWCAQHEDKPM